MVLRICPVSFGQLAAFFVFDMVALVGAAAAALLQVLHVCVKLFHQVAKRILNLKSKFMNLSVLLLVEHLVILPRLGNEILTGSATVFENVVERFIGFRLEWRETADLLVEGVCVRRAGLMLNILRNWNLVLGSPFDEIFKVKFLTIVCHTLLDQIWRISLGLTDW